MEELAGTIYPHADELPGTIYPADELSERVKTIYALAHELSITIYPYADELSTT